jgi:DNA-binding XRE family transcriptional regulator
MATNLRDVFRQVRKELGLDQATFAEKLEVSDRTVSRWENGEGAPSRAQCQQVIALFDDEVTPETRRAFEEAAGLRAPAAAPEPPAPAAAPAHDLHDEVDASVRAYAEELDVSARRLRLVLGLFLGDLERMAIDLPRARELVVRRKAAR